MLILVVIVILFNLIAICIPKSMTKIEMVINILFALSLQLIIDVYLDLKYDWYGYFEKGVDWGSLIYIFGIYPAVSIVFLNYFPYKQEFNRKIIYLLFWTVIALLFEVIFIESGTFYLNGWKTKYSVWVYPLLYLILVGFHKYSLYLLKDYSKIK